MRVGKKDREKDGITVGVDECGVGPLAGPVVAGAVILGRGFDKSLLLDRRGKIRDSKRTPKSKLPVIAKIIRTHCPYGIGEASPVEIDSLGITRAIELAMKRALEELKGKGYSIKDLIIDGIRAVEGQGRALIKADTRFFSVAAASIIAKDYRDAHMISQATRYPGYDLEKNKGYPTRDHIRALGDLGRTPIHRRSYRRGR